jgi:hypothetical protein
MKCNNTAAICPAVGLYGTEPSAAATGAMNEGAVAGFYSTQVLSMYCSCAYTAHC